MLSVMMKSNFYIGFVCLTAILVSTGCANDESNQRRILDVDHLWQGSVPVEYEIGENGVGICQIQGETELLIPYSISSNDTLQVELYGCWQGEELVGCQAGLFKEAEINTENSNSVIVSLLKESNEFDDCLGSEPLFQKWHTFDISGPWQPGELEIIVRNSDRDLAGYVTVE